LLETKLPLTGDNQIVDLLFHTARECGSHQVRCSCSGILMQRIAAPIVLCFARITVV
jgi:hypothetical protein